MYTLDELMRAIISSSPLGYVVSNEFGKVVFINEKIENITGWKLAELVNQELKKIVSFPESISKGALHEDNPELQATIVYCKDGSKVTLPAQIIDIKEMLKKDKFSGYLIRFHPDKTKGAVEKAQMEFVSTVSHELRTPLTSIRGFSETLLRSWDKLTSDVKRKYITIIKEQSERLTRLVEDLLAVSRLESHKYKLTLRAVDAVSLVKKVCESLSAKASNRKLVIKSEEDLPNVQADPDRLEQILTNLIDNAIKYSPEGTEITINLSSFSPVGSIKDKIKIEVIDQGIGIKENDLSKIFTKFGRVDNPMTRQAQGTGLGLFITKSLVLALKGEIFVNSGDSGTTFTVIMPAEIPSEAIPLSSGEAVRDSK